MVDKEVSRQGKENKDDKYDDERELSFSAMMQTKINPFSCRDCIPRSPPERFLDGQDDPFNSPPRLGPSATETPTTSFAGFTVKEVEVLEISDTEIDEEQKRKRTREETPPESANKKEKRWCRV